MRVGSSAKIRCSCDAPAGRQTRAGFAALPPPIHRLFPSHCLTTQLPGVSCAPCAAQQHNPATLLGKRLIARLRATVGVNRVLD